MRYREAQTALKQHKTKMFTLVGNEPFLKKMFIDQSREMFPSSQFFVFNDDELNDAMATISSQGFFGFKIVVLKRFDKRIKEIPGLLELNNGDIIIIELSEGLNFKRKDITSLLGYTCRVDCVRMPEYDSSYPTWIASHISEKGYKSDDGVEEEIYKRTGPSLFLIENELQKLFIFRESSKYILFKDVERIVSQRSSNSAYQILEALLKRDVRQALCYYDAYSRVHDNPLELIMFLEHYFEKMYRMILLHEQKMSVDDIAQIVGLPRFITKVRYLPKVLSLGKKFISNELDNAITLDVHLRKSPHSPKALIESWFYRFA